jgi:hypothetical protein
MPNVVPIQTLVYEMGGYVQLNTSSVVFQRVQRGRIISCTSLLFSPLHSSPFHFSPPLAARFSLSSPSSRSI